eukprot:7490342-Ditylum_brightwellii.AAC.1
MGRVGIYRSGEQGKEGIILCTQINQLKLEASSDVATHLGRGGVEISQVPFYLSVPTFPPFGYEIWLSNLSGVVPTQNP